MSSLVEIRGEGLSDEQKGVLIALFPSKELTQYALGNEMGVGDPRTAERRAERLIEQGLVQMKEEGEKADYKKLFSLTEEGQEAAREVVAERREELLEEAEEMSEKLDEWERVKQEK